MYAGTLCEALAPQWVQSECSKYVDEHIHTIVGALTELKPDEVCDSLRLCSGRPSLMQRLAGEARVGMHVE